MSRLVLFIALGFGTGRIPFAPGTWGTLVGFVWIYLLLLPGSLPLYILGTIAGLAAAIWIGSRAENILNAKDPGSIVIDEITALPIVFFPVLLAHPAQPAANYFTNHWREMLLTFILFRLFDIWKPLGIRKSQDWPGGLVIDDALAAVAAGLALACYVAALR